MSVAEVKEVIGTTGRRKSAVASIRLVPGEGRVKVNKRAFDEYFRTEALRRFIQQPLVLTNTLTSFNIFARVEGGGPKGQAGALRHAISRALTQADIAHRQVLKDAGCLTRDPRERERKKPGQPGARKRFQFSKR